MNDFKQTARVYEKLREFSAKNNVVIFTAVQAHNPNKEPVDIMDFAPNIVVLDYLKLC